jgi:hypothetical protein
MPSTERKSVTPRIARMLRELEGPLSSRHSAVATEKRAQSGQESRVLANALMLGGSVAKAH